MAINSRFIQVHSDALIEWIYDDQFFYQGDYNIINDTKNGISNFSFTNNSNQDTNNTLSNQLYLIDGLINKFGIVDTSKSFLQSSEYINNQPINYDKVKIWFPIHYTFPNSTGFYLNTYGLNFENNVKYNFSNLFIDTTDSNDLSKIEIESNPIRMNEKLWGKSITLYVPSLFVESRNRINNAPEIGTINYNLTKGVLGLSQTSPIYIDFRFLTSKSTLLGETTYLSTPSLLTNIPQSPEYTSLAVQIQEATDGDYFIINGIYNSTISEFDTFMNVLEQSGKRSYILYTITVYEENIPQDPRDIYVHQDFYKGIQDYRPVLKYTNTTASIRVDMKLINAVDSSVITKSAEYTLVGNSVAKYGKTVTPINISGAIKPKLYNSKPDLLALPAIDVINSHLKRKNVTKTEIRYVPYPVLTNVYDIAAQDGSVILNNQTYYGNGLLTIKLNPFDNIIKLNMFHKSTSSTFEPFNISSSNSIVQMVFKSSTSEIRIPLYVESNQVELSLGILVFKINQSNLEIIKKINLSNNYFYITVTTNGTESVLYTGKYDTNTNIVNTTSTTPTQTINDRSRNIKPFNYKIPNTENLISRMRTNVLTTSQIKKLR